MIKTKIVVGTKKPFQLIHMTDNHLCLADARDDDAKIKLAKERAQAFDGKKTDQTTIHYLEHIAYAKEKKLPVLCTGDLIDFVSHKNLDYVKETLSDIDLLFTPGNHEFSLYVGEAWEDHAYKMKSFHHIQQSFASDITQNARIIEEINFVGFDNSYYLFTKEQGAFLKDQANRGLPMVIFFHVPLFTEELFHFMLYEQKKPCAYVVGCPQDKMKLYSKERCLQQKADEDTKRFIAQLYETPNIKAIITGHIHENFEGKLPNGVTQYVTGAGYEGYVRELTFV